MDLQDDTFSDLFLRPSQSKLNSSGGSTALASQKQNVLPQPDEVIAIPERLQNATEMMSNTCQVEDAPRVPGDGEEDLEEGQALLPPEDDVVDAASMSLSSKTLPLIVAETSQNSSGSTAVGSRRYKPAAAFHNNVSTSSVASSSSAKNLLRHSNSALVGDIDSTFTPHKSGSASALSADMPKIKIFLPKSNDDDSSGDSSSDDDVAAAVNGDDRAVNVST